MPLQSALFGGDLKLEAAATSDPAHIMLGARGDHVARIQIALNKLDGAGLDTDGVYGPATAAAVLAYKRKRNIVNAAYQTQADNIVGKMTVAALDGEMKALESRPAPPPIPRGGGKRVCGNCLPENAAAEARITSLFINLLQAERPVAARFADSPFTPPDVPRPIPPSPWTKIFQPLTAAQITRAKEIYGDSLEYSTIFLSNQLGLKNAPFTLCLRRRDLFFDLVPGVPPDAKSITILNVGGFAPSDDVFIHELAHVWQSQHHPDPRQYMLNSVKSQGTAIVQNKLHGLVDSSLRTHDDFPEHFPFSAYAYLPGKPFGDYAAEQIANSIELGEVAIRAHVKAVAKGAVDPDNVRSLSVERTDDRRKKRVRFDGKEPPEQVF